MLVIMRPIIILCLQSKQDYNLYTTVVITQRLSPQCMARNLSTLPHHRRTTTFNVA